MGGGAGVSAEAEVLGAGHPGADPFSGEGGDCGVGEVGRGALSCFVRNFLGEGWEAVAV